MTKSGLAVILGLIVAAVGVIISYQQRLVSKIAERATEVPSAIAATEAPTDAPKPTVIPATAAPAAAWSVDFYPDNWTYELQEDQACAGVNWTSTGVTELKFGGEGSSGEKVEATGRKGDLCFGSKEADFFLEYRKPDGQVERKTIHLERDK